MKKNRAIFALSALVGVVAMLQTGCMEGGEPGTGIDPKSEFRNIKSALRRSDRIYSAEARIQLLRKTYDTADNLKTRWPEAPEVDPFLVKNRDKLDQIPHSVYRLSLEARDMESFRWAVNHSAKMDTQRPTLERFWHMGNEWRTMALDEFPEQAMPVFMEEALVSQDAAFFNAHANAFLNHGASLGTPLETTEFNCNYTRFLAREFDAAMKANAGPRIDFLLEYTPHRNEVPVLDNRAVTILKTLGDYLFYELKDEALASKLLRLRYPLNRIELDKTEFGDGFMKSLKVDAEHSVQLLELDQWSGPLSKQDTLFLVSLSANELKSVDQRYIEEIIELCVKRNKTDLALRYIKFLEKSDSITVEHYDKMLDWSIRYGNTELFEYIVKAHDEISLYEIDLVQLAANYKMFVKYAPRILTHLSKYETESEYGEEITVLSAMTEVLSSTNHAASVYLLKTYRLDRQWEPTEKEGRTLLMEMCLAGNLPAVKYLVETRREDLHVRSRYSEMSLDLFGRSDSSEGNLSVIHFAAKSGNSALIKYLVLKRVNVNAQTHYGVTPLMYAVSNGHWEATLMLISLRADVNASMSARFKDLPMPEPGSFDQLSTAYRRAQALESTEILSVLKKAGARP